MWGGQPQGEDATVITEEDYESVCEEVFEDEALDAEKSDDTDEIWKNVPKNENTGSNKNESDLIDRLVTKMKIEAFIFWKGLDLFGKIFTVGILITIVMFLVAVSSHKLIPVIASVVQAGMLVCAQLLHKEVLKCKKRNLKYIVLLIAIILAVLNMISYMFVNDTPISTHTEKEVWEGFDEETNVEVQVGNYIFSVPDYWEAEEESENIYQAYAEDSDKVVKLQIDSVEDDEDPVSFEILEEETSNGKMTSAIKSYFDATSKVTSEYFESGKIKGYIYSFEYEKDTIKGIGKCLVFPSGKNNHWIHVILLENDYSDYTYFGDFDSIINSIKQKQTSTKKKTKKESEKKSSKKKKKKSAKEKEVTTSENTNDSENKEVKTEENQIQQEDMDGKIKIAEASYTYKSANYNNVVSKLKEAGFENITAQAIYDLGTGFWDSLNHEEVESVAIAGKSDFEEGDVFDKTAEVIVVFHAFEKDNPDIVYTQYTADQLYQDLKDNPIRAQETHEDEFVELTGKISAIGGTKGYILIHDVVGWYALDTIFCDMTTEELENHLVELTTGDEVTIRGKIKTVDVIYPYTIDVYSFL